MTVPTVRQARAHRDAAKQRLHTTMERTRRKLNPKVLAQDAVDGARDRAIAVVGEAAEQVRRRPVAIAAGMAVITAFLARRRIARWCESKHDDATAPVADSYSAERA